MQATWRGSVGRWRCEDFTTDYSDTPPTSTPPGEQGRSQPTGSPSPELWFGTSSLELFAEHNESLAESRLEPALVRRVLAEAQRDALVAALPD